MMKRLNPAELRDFGYLQEANRQFFHPLGLALAVMMRPDPANPGEFVPDVRHDGSVEICVFDHREDLEGFVFGADGPDVEKAARVATEWETRRAARLHGLGFVVQLPGQIAPIASAPGSAPVSTHAGQEKPR